MPRVTPLPSVDYVIFDTDGTLVDDLELIVVSYNYAVSEVLGKKFETDEVSALFGPTMEKIMAEIVPSNYLKLAVVRYHEYYRAHFNEHATIYPKVRTVLSELQGSKKKMAVFTGAGRQIAKMTLELSGLSSYFSTMVTGDDVSQPKPDPEGLHLAMKAIGALAERTCYIGDSLADVEASRRASVRSGAALWGSRERDELRAMKPDFIFEEPSDVSGALLND